jgi:hypothetical protein
MSGRFAHLYSPSFNLWFIVIPAPDDISSLERRDTKISRISRSEFIRKAGARTYLEIIEDKLGIRLTHIARFIRKLPILRKIKWLKKIAYIDEWQDWEEWKKEAKNPQTGAWME